MSVCILAFSSSSYAGLYDNDVYDIDAPLKFSNVLDSYQTLRLSPEQSHTDPFTSHRIDVFDGTIFVKNQRILGLLNSKTGFPTKEDKVSLENFHNDYIIAEQAGKFGVLNVHGEWLIQPESDRIRFLKHSHVLVKKSNTYSIYQLKGSLHQNTSQITRFDGMTSMKSFYHFIRAKDAANQTIFFNYVGLKVNLPEVLDAKPFVEKKPALNDEIAADELLEDMGEPTSANAAIEAAALAASEDMNSVVKAVEVSAEDNKNLSKNEISFSENNIFYKHKLASKITEKKYTRLLDRQNNPKDKLVIDWRSNDADLTYLVDKDDNVIRKPAKDVHYNTSDDYLMTRVTFAEKQDADSVSLETLKYEQPYQIEFLSGNGNVEATETCKTASQFQRVSDILELHFSSRDDTGWALFYCDVDKTLVFNKHQFITTLPTHVVNRRLPSYPLGYSASSEAISIVYDSEEKSQHSGEHYLEHLLVFKNGKMLDTATFTKNKQYKDKNNLNYINNFVENVSLLSQPLPEKNQKTHAVAYFNIQERNYLVYANGRVQKLPQNLSLRHAEYTSEFSNIHVQNDTGIGMYNQYGKQIIKPRFASLGSMEKGWSSATLNLNDKTVTGYVNAKDQFFVTDGAFQDYVPINHRLMYHQTDAYYNDANSLKIYDAQTKKNHVYPDTMFEQLDNGVMLARNTKTNKYALLKANGTLSTDFKYSGLQILTNPKYMLVEDRLPKEHVAKNQLHVINLAKELGITESQPETTDYDSTVRLQGVIDKNGKEILPLKFERIYEDRFGHYITQHIEHNKRFNTVYDADFKQIIAPVEADINENGDSYTLSYPEKIGVLDNHGKTLVEPHWMNKVLSRNYMLTKDGIRFIGQDNENIPKNWLIYNKQSGSDNHTHVYDTNLKKQFTLPNTDIEHVFLDEYAVVKKHNDDAYYIIDKNGKTVGSTSLNVVAPFSEGLAAVVGSVKAKHTKVNVLNPDGLGIKKQGFIDKTGKLVIPLIYDIGSSAYFHKGTSLVSKNGKPMLIDKNQKDHLTIDLACECF